MKRATAAGAGYVAGRALDPVGRARRFALSDEEHASRELWLVPPADEALAARLCELGALGVGGFVDAGTSEEGVWLVRRLGHRTLAGAMRGQKAPWSARATAAFGRDVALALGALEKRSLGAGALTPDGISLLEGRPVLVADELVGALLGAQATARGSVISAASPLYTPPAQADGAPWDAAANRYVLGLLLYRLLAGAHPFTGAGLRHALGEGAHREAPPFEDAIARSMPPGLQSFVLRSIDPSPTERPKRAADMAEALAQFVDPDRAERTLVSGEAPPPRDPGPAPAPRPVERRARPTKPEAPAGTRDRPDADNAGERDDGRRIGRPATRSRAATTGRRALGVALPLVLGVAIAGGAFAALAPAPASPARRPPVGTVRALVAGETEAHDCASCHPRQAAEWRRSVMGHSVKSPLFNALESLIEEQVGRDEDCPNGAGILRKTTPTDACRNPQTNLPVSGSGGEHWCVNCHSPGENLDGRMPAWQGRATGDPRSRFPVRDLLSQQAMEGISCGFCHQVHGPVSPRGGAYQGNPTWTSFLTGATFASRPEDARGLFGIANSGYELRPSDFLLPGGRVDHATAGSPIVHRRASAATEGYLRSSEFCGGCHDVRLFGTDTLGAAKGERFKRLRNAYSEWDAWARLEERKGKKVSTCQDCHMSSFPGVCAPGPSPSGGHDEDEFCPDGTHFEERAPGSYPEARVSQASSERATVTTHYLSGVDLPLSHEYPDNLIDEETLDLFGTPLSAKRRRDLLLARTFRFDVAGARTRGTRLEIPIEVENVRAGHRVPAGFSQEREFWVHLKVTDARGRVVYEVGRVEGPSDDLHDKTFVRVNTSPDLLDGRGRPEGIFGADVRDGPDKPEWSPRPELGGTTFRGRGLINFQNGFLRCVTCIGVIGPDGVCEPGPGQGVFRADRFADGDYDLDTGECRSNLVGQNALFETYFPVGSLDASRGLPKAPDAIIDTRSVPPETLLSYTYDLDTAGARGPFQIDAELLFRAFPPYLIRAFAAYEREQAQRGRRPSGALVDESMLSRLEIVRVARAKTSVP